jgi:ABC-type branched-subunit amino acid transport system substrate-binding protein
MRKLVLEDKVLAVIGNVGTPTAVVSVPIANEQNLLLFGAFTGAGLLRKTPPDRYVINYRASYAEETEELVAGLLKAGIKPSEIAFFSQNDSYGDAGYQGALLALKKQGYEDGEKLAHGRYTRNTLNVEDAVVTVVEAAPRAVIMVGAYRPCAKFIQMVKTFLPNTLFANVSFVGSAQLALELGQAGEGVIVTQVVPPPQSGLPAVAEFQAELAKVKGEEAVGFDFSMLEGYLVAKLFVAGLQQAGSQPSRESLIDALEKLQNLDIGIGVPVSYSKTNHQASHQVWPTILRDGVYTPLQWESLRQAPPVPASVPKPKQNP